MKNLLDSYKMELMDVWQRNMHVCHFCGIVGPKYKLIPKSVLAPTEPHYICNTCYFKQITMPKPIETEKEKTTMEENNLTTYFVSEATPSESVRSALGRMIEYAKFLEKETGRDKQSFVDTILEEEDIEVTTECPTMPESIDEVGEEKLKDIIKDLVRDPQAAFTATDILHDLKNKYNIDLNSVM